MKKFRKCISLIAAAALLALLPNANALQASAAPAKTIYIRYDTDLHEWRMQIESWEEGDAGLELYYLNNGSNSQKALDGDTLVVLPNTPETDEEGKKPKQQTGNVDIKVNARLGNLTVNHTNVVIAATSIDECHVQGGSVAAISGNVTNAYVYDDAACTFNNNVTNLRLIATVENTVDTNVSVVGTVAYASTANGGGILKEYYNFAAGSFYFDTYSGLMTDPNLYSTTGNGPAAAPQTPAQTAAPSQSQTTSSSSSGEYDDVPKTGESNLMIWLFAGMTILSAMCAGGCFVVRKSRKE